MNVYIYEKICIFYQYPEINRGINRKPLRNINSLTVYCQQCGRIITFLVL